MEFRDVLKKIRRLEIKTRRAVNSTLAGGYHSVFKGRGMNFAEVRAYQFGDDVRLIDWNVTARHGTPYIKLFEEERELTVLLMVDLSGSGRFGSGAQSKREVAAEIAAVLAFSAIRNQDRVGLYLFTDKVEQYIPPKKGKNHVFWILREIFEFTPKGRKTSLSSALSFMLKTNKKKAIVFVLSDFMDRNYERMMRVAVKQHDVVPIVLEDPREVELPSAGLMVLEDEETGEVVTLNTGSEKVRQRFRSIVLAKRLEQERFFKSVGISWIRLDTSQSYFTALVRYFSLRGHRY